MTVSFWISSVGLGFIVPMLVQVFKKSKWGFWGKLLLAGTISLLVGLCNGYLHGIVFNQISTWESLSAAALAVLGFAQVFWKTTFESHFSGK